RLKLNGGKLAGCIQGLRQVATLADPIGHRQLHRELAAGLELERVTVPLGVLGVVFESRPDAVIQIAALAIRSGNGAILKGGREALTTCQAIVTALQEGLASSAVDPNSLDLLTSREESMALLQLDDLVDLIVPRGSNAFVRTIQDNTRIPVLGHADGVCHLYVDQSVDIDMAVAVALDAKIQYPAACNTIETLLVHRHVARQFLPPAIEAFTAAGVTLRGDEQARALGVPEVATPEDWGHEYLDLILAVRVVEDLDA
ncbi:MAG: gamma-glutamyl phosphate reductase, partial [Candidatus Synechococcus spongiarum 142]